MALSMPMSPKAIEWEQLENEKYKHDGSRSYDGVTSQEWKISLLRLSQIHLIYGRHLWLEQKSQEAISHFQSARYYTDQFCQMKRQFSNSNKPNDGWANHLSPGSMITLLDFLKVYETLGYYDKYLQLVTNCIGYLESNLPINYPQEYFDEHYEDRPEIKILDLPDLLCMRAHILMKQSGSKLTEAFQNLKNAISINPTHLEANQYMSKLANLSQLQHETACLMILKNRPQEAIYYLKIALSAQPETSSLYFDYASLLRRLGKLDKALEFLLQGVHLLKFYPNQNDQQLGRRNAVRELFYILLDTSWSRMNCGQVGLASMLLGHLEQAAPRHVLVYFLQGDCEYTVGNWSKALELYEKSKSLLVEFKNAQIQCVCQFVELYEYSLNMRICRTHYLLCQIKIESKQFEQALDNLTRCIHLFPFIPHYYVMRMKLHYQCNHLAQSWADLLACIYLYLSDASLIKRTNGIWAKLPAAKRHKFLQQLTKQVRESIGPILNRLLPKTHNLNHLANSQQCFEIAEQIANLVPRSRCQWCTNLGHLLESSRSSISLIKQTDLSLVNPLPQKRHLTSLNAKVCPNSYSNFELKMIRNDILKLRSSNKV